MRVGGRNSWSWLVRGGDERPAPYDRGADDRGRGHGQRRLFGRIRGHVLLPGGHGHGGGQVVRVDAVCFVHTCRRLISLSLSLSLIAGTFITKVVDGARALSPVLYVPRANSLAQAAATSTQSHDATAIGPLIR